MRSSSESTSQRQYNDRWIRRGRGAAAMAWPSRSPDLTPMDFFLWGHIKALIYTSPVDSEGNLSSRIVQVAPTIRQQPDIFERTRQSLLCRRPCIEVGGRTFEYIF
jgi:hypothetical protein